MIRKARRNDSEQIAKVLKESYNIDSIKEGKDTFLSETSRGSHYIVIEADGRIIGIATWYMHGLPKHGLVELDRIAVLPEYRGRGMGRELFRGLVNDASAYMKSKESMLRKLFLLTHESNAKAHRFYEKMGMKHETTLKHHYYGTEDERVYSVFFDATKKH
ncbi:MAG: hypothetical protein DRO99_05360 [Candidatus Aenigmatarchaeota archaeon]|nr:MAG: hypothetical protein DRO99_05360 [Candidatus Aenigmarchaeota archaeon]